ncbi:GNAT family N-acetyltransferase [Siculibacillus lacustris]|uniref:GNAT family N-acetyltransferase n=1 Tax=Siculibacillus lacustris TaxID=1549641 RepID=A0A4Q9VPV4_9HYPH|nr:GNAT family N-acetyltransferase [Siculibacillus lacustris]TBW36971.1 GNAT family N-acetyltransferase [Siculibacillus lacustris]
MTATNDEIAIVDGFAEVRETLAALPPAFGPTAFQHCSWLDCWLACAGSGVERVIAVVARSAGDGRARLVLPLVLDARGALPFWTSFDFGVSDYNLPLIATDFRPTPREAAALWHRIVAALPSGAAYLLIDKMPAMVGGRPTPFADLAGTRRSQVVRHPLPLDGDFESLRATRFAPSMVHSLARKRRKLGRKGDLAFHAGNGPEARVALDRLMTWRDERYGAQPETTCFYRRLTEAGDPARVLWLTLDGAPIAACFGIGDADGFRLLALGHDARFNNWSPGLLIVEDAIAWAVGEGFREFDFTIGAEPYKFDFGVEPEPMTLLAEAFDAQGAAVLRLQLARNYVAARLRRYLDSHRHGGGHHRRVADAA